MIDTTVLKENKKSSNVQVKSNWRISIIQTVVGKDMAQFVSPFKSQTLGKLCSSRLGNLGA